jgi:hypothetical protein
MDEVYEVACTMVKTEFSVGVSSVLLEFFFFGRPILFYLSCVFSSIFPSYMINDD